MDLLTERITPVDELIDLRAIEDKNDLHFSTLLLRYMKVVKTYSLVSQKLFQSHFDELLASVTNYASLLTQVKPINFCWPGAS